MPRDLRSRTHAAPDPDIRADGVNNHCGCRSTMIDQVVFQVASRAHHFMQEIAQLYCDGFSALGVPARIALDERPAPQEPRRLDVIVSPHKYFTFVLGPACGRAEQD